MGHHHTSEEQRQAIWESRRKKSLERLGIDVEALDGED